jgi:hypothetical protein
MRVLDFRAEGNRKRSVVVRRGWSLDLVPRGQPPAVPNLGNLYLSASTIAENSAAGTVVGAILGARPASTLTLVDSAGGRFAIAGANIVAAATATNFENATSHQITIRETLPGSANSPRETVISITVTNEFEQPNLSAISLSAAVLAEGSAAGTVVGVLLGKTSGSALALVDDAGGRFAISEGNLVAGATSTDFETATSHSVTVRETLADSANSPRETVLSITIGNVFEQPALSALTLSSSTATVGTSTSISINGATPGSTLAGAVPDGMVLNSDLRTITGTPTVTGTYDFTLTETLADSVNSPRVSNVAVTVAASAPQANATLFPAFADPGSTGVWSDLSAAERTQRQAVAMEMSANGWFVDPDATTFDDTVTISGSVQLDNWLNGTAVGGVTRNVTRNQKILLDPTGNYTFAALAANARFRALDWLANGKMLFIDGQGVSYRTKLVITGCRGIFIRNLKLDAKLSDIGGDLSWSPGWITTTYTNGGAGFQVGQLLTVVTRPSAVYKDPVLQVAAVGAGGAITAVTVLDRGMMTSTASMTFSSPTSTTNATLSGSFGTNPRDAQACTITRSATFPLAPVVTFDQCDVGGGYQTTNPQEYIVGINVDNCEQVVVTRCRFNGFQTGIKAPGCRRIVFHENDFRCQIGDSRFVTNTRGTTTVTAGTRFNDLWPDGLCYRWDSRNTTRDAADACDLLNSAGHDMGLDQEHSDCQQSGTSGDTGGYLQWSEFNMAYLERTTFKDRPLKGTRYYAGTQGVYLDDSGFAIKHGSFGDFAATLGSNVFTAWSGDVLYGRCTAVRVGTLAASGANANNSQPSIYSRKKFGTALSSTHTVRSCVASDIRTISSGTVYDVGNLVQSGNVLADPVISGAYATSFPGTFSVDGEGRTTYAFDDTVARSEFRSGLWSTFGKSGVGFFDPSTWG